MRWSDVGILLLSSIEAIVFWISLDFKYLKVKFVTYSAVDIPILFVDLWVVPTNAGITSGK